MKYLLIALGITIVLSIVLLFIIIVVRRIYARNNRTDKRTEILYYKQVD